MNFLRFTDSISVKDAIFCDWHSFSTTSKMYHFANVDADGFLKQNTGNNNYDLSFRNIAQVLTSSMYGLRSWLKKNCKSLFVTNWQNMVKILSAVINEKLSVRLNTLLTSMLSDVNVWP